MHLKKLNEILANNRRVKPFACIKDLVENGISNVKKASESQRTSRHEITLFLSAWFRLLRLEAEDYGDWLINYCTDVLSEISSSSSSQIRHSTKSTIKYIHNRNIPFSCNCEKNVLKAVCSTDCPIYERMKNDSLRNLEAEKIQAAEWERINKEEEPDPETLPVMKKYKKQYDEAVTLVKPYLDKGHTKKEIAAFLNEKGYRTITNHDWKPGSVVRISLENGWSPPRTKRRR